MTAPTITGSASGQGTGGGSGTLPAFNNGDLLVVLVGDSGGDKVITSTGQTWSNIDTQVAGAPVALIHNIWVARAVGSSGATTFNITDPGAAGSRNWISFVVAGGEVHDIGGSASAVQTTSISITGVTTTVNDCLVVSSVYMGDPEEDDVPQLTAGSWANANLSGFAEFQEIARDVSTGTDETLAAAAGTLASAGASGTSTATMTKTAYYVGVTIAFEPYSTTRGWVVGAVALN